MAGGAASLFALNFHDGGKVGTSRAPVRPVPAGLFNSAPRLHQGLRADEFPAILQSGETVLPRGQGSAGSSAVAVTINCENYGTPQQMDVRGAIWNERGLILDIVQRDATGDGQTARVIKEVVAR